MSYYVGVDLGQANDFTAITVIEETGATGESPLRVVYLERLPLGTYYPEQVDRIKEIVTDDRLSTEIAGERREFASDETPWGAFRRHENGRVPLVVGPRRRVLPEVVVDATGVGRPVVDMMRKEGLQFAPVLITGGDTEHVEKGFYRVPKRNLVSSVQVALQTGRLVIHPHLDLADTLRKELLNFRIKINLKTAHDSYEAWREGDHDDLVLAVALAAWRARKARGATVFSF